MRKKRLLLCSVLYVLLCAPTVVSVEAASMWSGTYGGTDNDYAYSLVEASDGGYAIAGTWNYTTYYELDPGLAFPALHGDFWLVKTDASGNMLWNQTYGGAGNDGALSLIATSDGGYAMAGFTDSFAAVSGDFWLVKTDASGNELWNQTYGGTADEWAHSLIETSDGGYALIGVTNSFGAGGLDFWLVKTDSLGNALWNQTYGGPWNDIPSSLVATSDGGYAMVGSMFVKTDALGNMQWNQTYEGTSLVATSDGGYAIADNPFLLKTNSLGTLEWNKTYAEGEPYSLVVTSDGGYAIAGNVNIFGGGGGTLSLIKTDANGTVEWVTQHGGPRMDVAYSIVATSDGGYAIAGHTDSFGAGDTDFWLVKTDEFGVVPEYSSLLVPALVLTATAFIIINKKKMLRKRSLLP